MDWRAACKWGFCLLVICPVILAQTQQEKKTEGKNGAIRDIPLKSESNVKFVTSEGTELHSEAKHLANAASVPAFQIETPLLVKKFKKVVRRKKLKPSKDEKTGHNADTDSEKELTKKDSEQVLTQDSSVAQESLRIEERSSDMKKNFRNEPKFSTAQFVPSENFPKNIAAHSHQGSTRLSAPFANGDVKYVVKFSPDSLEEQDSRSDSSSEDFESKRQPSGFKNRQHSSDDTRNQIQSEIRSRLSRNNFPSEEARKVTIIKEKTIHSTSSQEEQERVNIEKNPITEERSDIVIHHHERSPEQNEFVPPTINNREKVLLIEGTRIPGRNYGPTDDTFGFHANSYKDDNVPPPSKGRKVKIVKVIKNRPVDSSTEFPVNNHGDGESTQYFVSERQRNKGKGQAPVSIKLDDGRDYFPGANPRAQRGGTNNFPPSDAKVNAQPAVAQPKGGNQLSDGLYKHPLQSSNRANSRSSPPHSGDQPVVLNINPDPNELYIDENTGQLIKFVISEDSDQDPQKSHSGQFNNQIQGKEIYSQSYELPEENEGSYKSPVGGLGLSDNAGYHQPQNGYGEQGVNLGENVQYIEVKDDDAIHLIIPKVSQSEGQQDHPIPNQQLQGNVYDQGKINSNEDSAEYVITCDQEGQDISLEYQAENLGQNYNQKGTDSYGQSNGKAQNQFPSPGYGSPSGGSQKGQSFQQGKNIINGINPGNKNNQNYGTRLQHGNIYNAQSSAGQFEEAAYAQNHGNSKGSNFGNNDRRVTNFATPPPFNGVQGHYKGTEFSNNKDNSKVPVYKETVTPAYPVEDVFPPTKGFNNAGNVQGYNNKGSGFGNQKGFNSGDQGFNSNQGYGQGLNVQIGGASVKGNSHGLGLANKGHAAGGDSQGQNKENGADQVYISEDDLLLIVKGDSASLGGSNQKGYDSGSNSYSGSIPANFNKGSGVSNSKGYDSGNSNNQNYNSGGGIKGDSYSTGNQKGSGGIGYNSGGNKFPREIFGGGDSRDIKFPGQKGYKSGIDGMLGNGGYDSEEELVKILAVKGDQGDTGLFNQQAYSQTNAFSGNKGGDLLSIILSSKGSNKGPSQGGYNSGASSGNKGYEAGNNLDLFSGGKGISGSSNNKGYNSGNNAPFIKSGYESDSIPESLLATLSLNKGSSTGNSGYEIQGGGGSDYGSGGGGNYGSGNNFAKAIAAHNNYKGSNLKQKNEYAGYGKQSGGNSGYGTGGGGNYGSANDDFPKAVAADNNYKGSNFKQNNGNAGYGKQSGGNSGYGTGGGGNQGSSGDDDFTKAIAAHNYKGSNFKQNNGNAGYGKQSGGNSGYGTGGGGNQGSSGDDDFTKAIAAHNNYKGSNFKQNNGNAGYGKQSGGNSGYGTGGGGNQGSSGDDDFTKAIAAHNNYKGSNFKQNNGNAGYGKQSGGNSGYGTGGGGNQGSSGDDFTKAIAAHNYKGSNFKQNSENSGYGKGDGRGVGYGNQMGGNSGYGKQGGGNSGYGTGGGGNQGSSGDDFTKAIAAHNNYKGSNFKQNSENSGYGKGDGGGVGYGNQMGGNSGYGKQGGGNSGYGTGGGGNQGSSGDDFTKAIAAHNNYKGSNFKQNSENSGYGKGDGGGVGYGNPMGGNSGYGKQGGGNSEYDANSGENYGSGNDNFAKANAAHNNYKGSNFKQNNGNSGSGKQNGGNFGYGKQSSGNSGYGTQAGGNAGYGKLGGNSGYVTQLGGNAGYGKQSGGNLGYGTQTGGNVGYGKPNGGNSGYGKQNSGNSGYDSGENYGSGNDDLNKQVIDAHNTYKGSSFKQKGGDSSYGKQSSGDFGHGSQGGGNAGYGKQGGGGDAGYGKQGGGGDAGYGKQGGGGDAGYGKQSGGGSVYGKQNGGNLGYGQQSSGKHGGSNSGYGTQSGGNYNSQDNEQNKQIIAIHNNYKGSNINQNFGNSKNGKQSDVISGYGQSGKGNLGYGQQSAGKSGYNQQIGGALGYGQQTLSNSGYGQQGNKGSGYGKQAGGTAYGGQRGQGIGGSSKGQNYNSGHSVSYSSGSGDQYQDNQGPDQYILIEEDDPAYKNGNGEEVYLLPYGDDGNQGHKGNDQAQTYLIVDDSSQQQYDQQNLKVMVDGKKDRLFPIRQLATVGLHMANSVLPQIGKSKAKSIKGKISFGVEIQKGQQIGQAANSQQYGPADGHQQYLEHRSDKRNAAVNRGLVTIK